MTPPRLFSATRRRAARRLAGSVRLCSDVLRQVQRLHLRACGIGNLRWAAFVGPEMEVAERGCVIAWAANNEVRGLASKTSEPSFARRNPREPSLLCIGCTTRASRQPRHARTRRRRDRGAPCYQSFLPSSDWCAYKMPADGGTNKYSKTQCGGGAPQTKPAVAGPLALVISVVRRGPPCRAAPP